MDKDCFLNSLNSDNITCIQLFLWTPFLYESERKPFCKYTLGNFIGLLSLRITAIFFSAQLFVPLLRRRFTWVNRVRGSGLIFPCDLVLEMFWSTIFVCVEGMCVAGQWVGCSTSHFHLNATWFCDLCDATWPKYSNPHGSLMLERTASVDFWTYKHALHACVWNNLLSLQDKLLDHKRWPRLVFNLSWSTETWCWKWRKTEKVGISSGQKCIVCVYGRTSASPQGG